MVGRYLTPRTALVSATLLALGACNAPGPKIDKNLENYMERQKAAASVDEGTSKEVAPLGTVETRPHGPGTLHGGESIWIQSGKSRVLNVPYNVSRVSIGNPDLAGVVVLGPRSILINAKELPREEGENEGGGTRSSRSGLLSSRTFTPPPHMAETTVILWDSGNHTDSHTVYVTDFLAEQVLLEVTVAELDRTKMEERGISIARIGQNVNGGYFLGGGAQGGTTVFNPGTGRRLLPDPFPIAVDQNSPTFFYTNQAAGVAALVTMLEQNGLATVLAQPKILALSGQNAVFQVGGEIPIRIVTSFSAEVEFKAFGTLVNFLPHISEDGDIILTVTPEVSQPDLTNPVEGIPTFRVRRASTTAKLREGESLVIGGLVAHTRTENTRGIPYLKDLPYAGQLFRDTTYSDEVNELMVIVKPHLVRNLAPGTDLDLPSDQGPLKRDDVRTKPDPAEFTRPRLPTPAYNSSKPNR